MDAERSHYSEFAEGFPSTCRPRFSETRSLIHLLEKNKEVLAFIHLLASELGIRVCSFRGFARQSRPEICRVS
jgi:hypothetical protein